MQPTTTAAPISAGGQVPGCTRRSDASFIHRAYRLQPIPRSPEVVACDRDRNRRPRRSALHANRWGTSRPCHNELPVRFLLVLGLLALPLSAGVRDPPPFAMEQVDSWQGLSIEAWEDVAAENGWTYRYVPADLADVLDGVEAGRFDVGLGGSTITAEHERTLDFSHPFHTSGLGLAVRRAAGSAVWRLLARLVSLDFLRAAVSLGLLLVFGVLVWLFERRANPDEFNARVGPGIGAGFWWDAVTMTTVGYGDKSPRSLGGYLIELIWMFAAIIVISGFTAAITSSLTVYQLGSTIKRLDDLQGRTIGALAESASAQWLDEHGFRTATFDTLEDALDRVADGTVPAALYEPPLPIHRIGERDDADLPALSERVERLDYALELPADSPLREPTNLALLETTRDASWRDALQRWLPQR